MPIHCDHFCSILQKVTRFAIFNEKVTRFAIFNGKVTEFAILNENNKICRFSSKITTFSKL